MAKESLQDGVYAMHVALGAQAKGTRLSLTTSSAAFDASDITSGAHYKVSLDPTAGGAAWIEWGGTATLPASSAVEAAGFWLLPGESEVVKAQANLCSAILTAGTGTLYLTRLS
jgi:hypothetical protein